MTNRRSEPYPAPQESTFGTIYRYMGRRVYLFILFIMGVLFLLLLLFARQRSEILYTQEQLARNYGLASTRPATQTDEGNNVTRFITTRPVITSSTDTLTVDNYSFFLDGLYVRPPDVPADGDIAGSYDDGFTVNADSVALTTDTVGDYVGSIVTGDGLTGGASGEGAVITLAVQAGDGVLVGSDGVSIALQTGGGLTLAGGALSLLDGCSDGQMLQWDSGAGSWGCANDDAGGGSLSVRESDGAPSATPVPVLEFGPATSSSEEFAVTDEGGGVARVRTGTAVPLTNTSATITGAWTFSSEIVASGGISCTNCITLGSETAGDYLAGLLAGSGLSVTGASGEGSSPTVSLDSSLAIFQTIDTSLGSDPVADSLTDTLSLSSGNGVNVTGNSAADSVTFDVNLASGSGLSVSGSGLSLQSCSDGQILKRTAGAWACASGATTALATAYQQQLAGTDNVAVGASLTPVLTNGSGTAQSLAVTIASGNEVTITATIEITTSLAAGPATYVIIRDDNSDNDCAVGGGDGTQIGGQVTGYVATVLQSFTTSFTFADLSPPGTTNRYQLCASTTIGLGTVSITDRSLTLQEVNL